MNSMSLRVIVSNHSPDELGRVCNLSLRDLFAHADEAISKWVHTGNPVLFSPVACDGGIFIAACDGVVIPAKARGCFFPYLAHRFIGGLFAPQFFRCGGNHRILSAAGDLDLRFSPLIFALYILIFDFPMELPSAGRA